VPVIDTEDESAYPGGVAEDERVSVPFDVATTRDDPDLSRWWAGRSVPIDPERNYQPLG
jgi:hypothetical protein